MDIFYTINLDLSSIFFCDRIYQHIFAILRKQLHSVTYGKYAPLVNSLQNRNSALFAHLDEIPTLPKCRKRKAKCRVRSIPTKRNGVYSTSE